LALWAQQRIHLAQQTRPALASIELLRLAGGESHRFDFEHQFEIQWIPTGLDDVLAFGTASDNSYYCGLWLQAEGPGANATLMPSEFIDPASTSERFALAQSGVVTELTGPIQQRFLPAGRTQTDGRPFFLPTVAAV
jgi:hypothetical protein